MNITHLSIAVLTCVLLSMTEGAVLYLKPQCRCTETQSTPVQLKRIQKFVNIAPGPHCKLQQVIATVKFKKAIEICVNPQDQWVQDAMKKKGLVI